MPVLGDYFFLEADAFFVVFFAFFANGIASKFSFIWILYLKFAKTYDFSCTSFAIKKPQKAT